MKKLLMGILTLISMNTFACHLAPRGSCGGRAYFTATNFFNHNEVQVRYFGTTTVVLDYVSKATGVTDTTISVDVPVGDSTVKVQFRYRDNTLPTSTGWVEWQDGIASDGKNYQESSAHPIPECSLLSVKFQDMHTIRIDANTVKLVFTVGDAVKVDSFTVKMTKDISLPKDQIKWTRVTVLTPDALKPNTTYSAIIKL